MSIDASEHRYLPCDPSVQEAQAYLETLWIPEICAIKNVLSEKHIEDE